VKRIKACPNWELELTTTLVGWSESCLGTFSTIVWSIQTKVQNKKNKNKKIKKREENEKKRKKEKRTGIRIERRMLLVKTSCCLSSHLYFRCTVTTWHGKDKHISIQAHNYTSTHILSFISI
jgi:hypothetical protein